jgi:hypothetical protein
LYVAQDANYTSIAAFDTSGNVVERNAYDPYGVATILAPDWSERPASLFAWQHLHQGLRLDPLTGLTPTLSHQSRRP